MRDIDHEQIAASTDAQLTDRLEDIRRRAFLISGTRCYQHRELREMHGIISELYCRACLIESQPWVTICPPRSFTDALDKPHATLQQLVDTAGDPPTDVWSF